MKENVNIKLVYSWYQKKQSINQKLPGRGNAVITTSAFSAASRAEDAHSQFFNWSHNSEGTFASRSMSNNVNGTLLRTKFVATAAPNCPTPTIATRGHDFVFVLVDKHRINFDGNIAMRRKSTCIVCKNTKPNAMSKTIFVFRSY